jgi:hypothetical protein
MTPRARASRVGAWVLIVSALIIALTPVFFVARAQPPAVVTADGNPLHVLPKACWPEYLLVGRDTAFAAIPCNSLDVFPPGVRSQVDCVLQRLERGGWPYRVYETYRSDRRQRWLYAQGRTRPGPRVTNVATAQTGNHYWSLGIDVIHRTKLWDHPRFFYWLGQHYEACGMVAGAFWKRFPDAPHGQFAAWESAAQRPAWAKRLQAEGKRDSLWLRLGVTR